MPNDTHPSPPGPQPAGGNELQEQDQDQAPGTASPATTTESSSSDSSGESDETKGRRAWHTTALKQRLAFHTDLLKRFDTLIYAEIAFLYYLEASFPRLMLRLIIHAALLSPSGPDVPAPKPSVQSLLASHIICVLLHCYVSLPQPPKGSRGYMHGGVWPDFIGQRPPTSRIYLLLLDFIIVGAQFFMLAVLEESKRVRKALQGGEELDAFLAREREARTEGGIESGDLEAAERGEVGRRPEPGTKDQDQDHLLVSSTSAAAGASRRSNNLSSESEAHAPESAYALAEEVAHPLDEYNSGNMMLGTFHVMHTAAELYNNFDLDKSDQSLQSAGYMTGLYWTRLQRVAGRAPV